MDYARPLEETRAFGGAPDESPYISIARREGHTQARGFQEAGHIAADVMVPFVHQVSGRGYLVLIPADHVAKKAVAGGDDFSLRTSVLHQKAIKCHRLSVVCHDQYGERAFVVVVWSVFVVFALLSTRWQIAFASLSFSFVLSFLPLSSFLPTVCPPPWPL
jgi:hypothetical protein